MKIIGFDVYDCNGRKVASATTEKITPLLADDRIEIGNGVVEVRRGAGRIRIGDLVQIMPPSCKVVC